MNTKELNRTLSMIKNLALDAKTHVKDGFLIAALDRVLEARKQLDLVEAEIRARIRGYVVAMHDSSH